MIPSQAVKVIVMPKIFITHQDLKVPKRKKKSWNRNEKNCECGILVVVFQIVGAIS